MRDFEGWKKGASGKILKKFGNILKTFSSGQSALAGAEEIL